MKRILMLAAMLLMAGMVNAKVVEKTFTVRGHGHGEGHHHAE